MTPFSLFLYLDLNKENVCPVCMYVRMYVSLCVCVWSGSCKSDHVCMHALCANQLVCRKGFLVKFVKFVKFVSAI